MVVSRFRAAVAGITAAAVAIGVAELVAVWTGGQSAPLIAVGGFVVDTVPEPAKHLAIQLFGTNDKTALLVGTGILLAAFAALIGIATAWRRESGYIGIGLFAAIGVGAAMARPDATPLSVLPTLIGSAAALFVLFGLISPRFGPAGEASEEEPEQPAQPPPARRNFLVWTAAALGGAAVVGVIGRVWGSRRSVESVRAEVTLPAAADPAPPVPANAETNIQFLARYVTPNDDFYRIDTALVLPQVDPDSWELRIHGRVNTPITLSYADLLKRPMVERYVTLACVSNPVGGDLIGNARWLGVPIATLLAEAGPQPGADQVVMKSADDWTCGTPTSVLTDGRDALLAIGMNGEPLPVAHGFPARMVVPGLYGYVSACKWIVEMELTSFADFDAYWVRRGWAEQGPIKTQSRIDVPRSNGTVAAGEVVVAGVAWAQHRGVSVVEVRVDGGPWQPAELAGTVSNDTWRQWTYRWQAAPGKHELAVRAADVTGAVQPGGAVPEFPDGAEGWHTINVTVS